MNKIIIAGGRGLIGSHLTSTFKEKGYKYIILSRSKNSAQENDYAYWDPDKGILDPEILEGADILINLSGSNVGKGRWTKRRKQDILDSRIKSTQLLFETSKKLKKKPKVYISSSAVGYYGLGETSIIHTESEEAATDFLGSVCKQWEDASNQFQSIGVRTVIFRTGLVLAKDAKAWKKMKFPVLFGLGTSLGSGRQIVPWIHVTDIVNMYLYAMFQKTVKGVYNAVAPEYSSMNLFYINLAKHLRRPNFLPAIPSFIVRFFMGEKSQLILSGNRISSEKIQSDGYHFTYHYLEKAFEDLC